MPFTFFFCVFWTQIKFGRWNALSWADIGFALIRVKRKKEQSAATNLIVTIMCAR